MHLYVETVPGGPFYFQIVIWIQSDEHYIAAIRTLMKLSLDNFAHDKQLCYCGINIFGSAINKS